jgi:hypothetical protein
LVEKRVLRALEFVLIGGIAVDEGDDLRIRIDLGSR